MLLLWTCLAPRACIIYTTINHYILLYYFAVFTAWPLLLYELTVRVCMTDEPPEFFYARMRIIEPQSINYYSSGKIVDVNHNAAGILG